MPGARGKWEVGRKAPPQPGGGRLQGWERGGGPGAEEVAHGAGAAAEGGESGCEKTEMVSAGTTGGILRREGREG